jgi:hypothetical protein
MALFIAMQGFYEQFSRMGTGSIIAENKGLE